MESVVFLSTKDLEMGITNSLSLWPLPRVERGGCAPFRGLLLLICRYNHHRCNFVLFRLIDPRIALVYI